jgi:hypothetical protein
VETGRRRERNVAGVDATVATTGSCWNGGERLREDDEEVEEGITVQFHSSGYRGGVHGDGGRWHSGGSRWFLTVGFLHRGRGGGEDGGGTDLAGSVRVWFGA